MSAPTNRLGDPADFGQYWPKGSIVWIIVASVKGEIIAIMHVALILIAAATDCTEEFLNNKVYNMCETRNVIGLVVPNNTFSCQEQRKLPSYTNIVQSIVSGYAE